MPHPSDTTTAVPARRATGAVRRTLAMVVLVAVAAMLLVAATPRPADAATTMRQFEARIIQLHNAERAARGLRPLTEHATITVDARNWSQQMASRRTLEHQIPANGYTHYSVTSCQRADPGWRWCAENVGVGWDADGLHRAFMDSTGHRNNILNDQANRIGVGAWRGSDGRLWVTVRFLAGTTAATAAPPTHPQDMYAAGTALSERHSQVLRLYRAFFGREPDRAGAEYWMGIVDRGTSLTTIAESFAAGREFQIHYEGTSNHTYVTKVYRNVLGRNADAAGFAYWKGMLDQRRLTRAGVVLYITQNTEFINRYPYRTMP